MPSIINYFNEFPWTSAWGLTYFVKAAVKEAKGTGMISAGVQKIPLYGGQREKALS